MWRLNHYNHFHQILLSILAAEMFYQIPHRYLPHVSIHTVTPVNIECVLHVAVCWWGPAAPACSSGAASPGQQHSQLELETNLHQVWSFTIREKGPSRPWLKAPNSSFTFKTKLRHYAKLCYSRYNIGSPMHRSWGRRPLRISANHPAYPNFKSTYCECLSRFLDVKALVGAFNQEKALVGPGWKRLIVLLHLRQN